MTTQNDMELRWIFRVILRRFWIILACAALVGLIALIGSFLTPLTYKASAKILVEPAKNTRSNEFDTLAAAERLAFTYSQMMKNTNVIQGAIDRLGLDVTPESLKKKIGAEPIKDTHLILLTVVEETPEKAAALANALADSFIEYNQELQMQKFVGSLEDNQKKIDELKTSIQQSHAQIDAMTAKKLEDETRLDELKESQIENKSDFRLLQRNQQEIQLKLQQIEEHVTISEFAQPAQGQENFLTNVVTTTLLINQNPVIEGNDYSAILAGERLASTYSQVITSRPVVEAALQKAGSGQTYDDLIKNIQASPVAGTLLIKLTVSGSDKEDIAVLANAIAEEFIYQNKMKYRKSLEDQLTEFEDQMEAISKLIDQTDLEISALSSSLVQIDTEISRVSGLLEVYQNDLRSLEQNEEQISLEKIQAADSVMLMESATPPKGPIQNRGLIVILAVLVGSMVGVAAAFVLQYLDNRIYSTEDVRTVLGFNVLGVIGRRKNNDPELIVEMDQHAPLPEQFSVLAMMVRNALASKAQQKILLVTSPTPSEGKSFVSANLAVAMAKAGLRVILIDADLRQPRIHQIFKIRKSRGMAELLKKDVWQIELDKTKVEGLQVLAGGIDHNNPVQVFNSPKMRDFFYTLKQKSDLIIIDCPPILSFADTQILAGQSNGVLLVLRSGKSLNQAAQNAKEILDQTGSPLIGVILNDMHDRVGNSYYYYGYGQRSNGRPSAAHSSRSVKQLLNRVLPQRGKSTKK